MKHCRLLITLSVILALTAAPAWAQVESPAPASPSAESPSLELGRELNLDLSFDSGSDSEVKLTAEFQVVEGKRDGRLAVKAEIIPHWHIYSITQRDGGPMRSELTVDKSDRLELVGPFEADRAPEERHFEFWTVPAEEHEGEVVWTAPMKLAEGVSPEELVIDVTYTGQVCADAALGGQCINLGPVDVQAKFAGFFVPEMTLSEYRAARSHVTLTGFIEPARARPGDEVKLVITAVPEEHWHVYAYAERDPKKITKPTVLALYEMPDWPVRKPVASSKPVEKETGLAEQPVQFYYEEPVNWTLRMTIPADATEGEYPIGGVIGYQTCNEEGICDAPTAAQFTATLVVDSTAESTRSGLEFDGFASFAKADDLAAEMVWSDSGVQVAGPPAATGLDIDSIDAEATAVSGRSTLFVLATAFVAGFILNFMPCVLPVIGLKVMAFVQQAGQQRSRVFMLNLWYVCGLMSVFLVLAVLAVVAGQAWADHFNSPAFNAVLASIVFAFALSFLGVWEIPVPGFASTGTVDELSQQEGAVGAFAKGILTTVLATPCAGPLLVPALAWAVAQPPAIAFTAYACVGLGMASPFLVIGVFPGLISFLPKPGPWMDTFKHAMGFVLLGTVVILLTFVPMEFVIPIVAFLIGLWAALWWVGRVPLYDPLGKRIRGWVEATAFAGLVGFLSFGWLADVMQKRLEERINHEVVQQGGATGNTEEEDEDHLPWQPYSLALLEQLTAENKTVLVDFTAPS